MILQVGKAERDASSPLLPGRSTSTMVFLPSTCHARCCPIASSWPASAEHRVRLTSFNALHTGDIGKGGEDGAKGGGHGKGGGDGEDGGKEWQSGGGDGAQGSLLSNIVTFVPINIVTC